MLVADTRNDDYTATFLQDTAQVFSTLSSYLSRWNDPRDNLQTCAGLSRVNFSNSRLVDVFFKSNTNTRDTFSSLPYTFIGHFYPLSSAWNYPVQCDKFMHHPACAWVEGVSAWRNRIQHMVSREDQENGGSDKRISMAVKVINSQVRPSYCTALYPATVWRRLDSRGRIFIKRVMACPNKYCTVSVTQGPCSCPLSGHGANFFFFYDPCRYESSEDHSMPRLWRTNVVGIILDRHCLDRCIIFPRSSRIVHCCLFSFIRFAVMKGFRLSPLKATKISEIKNGSLQSNFPLVVNISRKSRGLLE